MTILKVSHNLTLRDINNYKNKRILHGVSLGLFSRTKLTKPFNFQNRGEIYQEYRPSLLFTFRKP